MFHISACAAWVSHCQLADWLKRPRSVHCILSFGHVGQCGQYICREGVQCTAGVSDIRRIGDLLLRNITILQVSDAIFSALHRTSPQACSLLCGEATIAWRSSGFIIIIIHEFHRDASIVFAAWRVDACQTEVVQWHDTGVCLWQWFAGK